MDIALFPCYFLKDYLIANSLITDNVNQSITYPRTVDGAIRSSGEGSVVVTLHKMTVARRHDKLDSVGQVGYIDGA